VKDTEKFSQIEKLLTSFYGSVVVDRERETITVNFDGVEAVYNFRTQVSLRCSFISYLTRKEIDCKDEAVKNSLEEILVRLEAAFPINSL
jgi:hypothetical protein